MTMVGILVDELIGRLKGRPDKKPLRTLSNDEFDLLVVVLQKRGLLTVPDFISLH